MPRKNIILKTESTQFNRCHTQSEELSAKEMTCTKGVVLYLSPKLVIELFKKFLRLEHPSYVILPCMPKSHSSHNERIIEINRVNFTIMHCSQIAEKKQDVVHKAHLL